MPLFPLWYAYFSHLKYILVLSVILGKIRAPTKNLHRICFLQKLLVYILNLYFNMSLITVNAIAAIIKISDNLYMAGTYRTFFSTS